MSIDPAPNVVDDHGCKVGRWTEVDSHGGTITGEYVAGERSGVWRHYFADGSLRSEGEFDHGRLHGTWTWYRATGGLLQRGGFLDDEKHGLWQRWDAHGNQIDSGTWERGAKSGEWTSFHPDGTIKKTTAHRPSTAEERARRQGQ